MRFETGLFGGAFDPPHLGHLNVIVSAASMCAELYVALSYSRSRDSVPMEHRYRWLRESLRHMEHVHILPLEDRAASKEEYDADDAWLAGRDEILAKIGKPVDAVFCGSDYAGTNRYESLYGAEVVYFDRAVVPVSSTQIRRAPLRYWEWLPRDFRPYYARRVLLVGGESTGKSTMAANLALLYNTCYLEEVGREVCDRAGSEELMIAEDFHEILIRHKAREMERIRECNRVLFVDTDALTTKFYARFLLTDPEERSHCDALADAIAGINRFDLILFLEPTVAFVQDGTRNERIAADREAYSRQIKELFDARGLAYHCLRGDHAQRLARARELVDELLKEDAHVV